MVLAVVDDLLDFLGVHFQRLAHPTPLFAVLSLLNERVDQRVLVDLGCLVYLCQFREFLLVLLLLVEFLYIHCV